MRIQTLLWLSILFLIVNLSLNAELNPGESFNKNWTIFSSAPRDIIDSTVSTLEFKTDEYYRTDIPKTILAALVDNGVYKNPYFGNNLSAIPTEPFQNPWWYRKEFNITEVNTNTHYQLTLEGINYKADLWINGKKVADTVKIEGAFGRFDFDVTDFIVSGKNVIAIKVHPPRHGDLTLGFVDWNPSPPDKNLGLWRGVEFKKTGKVSLKDLFVKTKITHENPYKAELTISGMLTNFSSDNLEVEVKGSFDKDRTFSKSVLLKPGSKTEFIISPNDAAGLKLANPHLWWPNNLGEPYLYNLNIQVYNEGKLSDDQDVSFGIREVEDYINDNGYRGYKINGKKIVIKGAGWVDDLMLNDSDEKVKAQIEYARHMNLNTIRLEGFWGKNKTLYDAADENGILLMIGWSCQWEWEGYCGRKETKYMCIDTPKDVELQTWAFNEQVKWLRNHPSILVWVFGSDKYPSPDVQKKLNQYLAASDPTRPTLLSCQDIKIPASENIDNIYENSGVKMFGPYDYEPPVYWYTDTRHGGAYGFNTETGPGPQVPPIESIIKMLPKENLWPIDSMWEYHCGRNEFNTLNRYIKAFNNRYGKASSIKEFAMKSQMSNYEAMRPMFEAFGINKFNSTGVIQWMFNSAWPEMYWQLFDHYLMPNGAFYGAMKGCQPLNIAYNYGDKNIYVINDYNRSFDGLIASVKILNTDSKVIYENNKELSVAQNSSEKVIELPEIKRSDLFFVNLELKDNTNKPISDNFYWISAKADSLDFQNSEWFYTPMKSYADFNELNNLTASEIKYTETFTQDNENQNVEVVIENISDKIAFFIELKVVDEKTGQSLLPVFWSDNYISVLPHSKKSVKGNFKTPGQEKPKLIIDGWNIKDKL